MINFLKNFILDLLYGKSLGVDDQRVREYKAVETAFAVLKNNPFMPACLVTGDTLDKMMRDLPCCLHFVRKNCPYIRHMFVPAIYYQFFLRGGTWVEIEEYNQVVETGMIGYQKRRI